ncbi:hypothetical protein CORT_0F02770 [Candida orthopsilosis Co 90-125]|uniref:Uncharacterized protein n=1 Tax=Candida orthopsilosis (strain 90-125) TaxID=1136231 RepID=H8X8M6_CANO9|nr:hypothetical protein CORT_0F02770 [Candida orthopsilosis Co 90-125]CCG24501.1 hypothetical protein CORT_0F02770 [Candida orthopsilosis Co 90-125]
MDAASCGPSSAIQNLNKHTQRDTSLQHQRLGDPPQQQGVHQFRQGQSVDQQLNQEFHRFNNDGLGHDFAMSFMEQNRPQFQHQHHVPQPQQQQQGWVNDFSNMSIEQRQQPQVNNWSRQFMQSGPPQQQHQQKHHQQQQQQQQQRQYQQPMTHGQLPNYSIGTFQNRLNMNAVSAAPQFAQQTEHQQVHKLEADHAEILENEFDRLEKELAQETQTSEANLTESVDKAVEDHDRDLFAETARSVENSMNKLNTDDAAMAEKFKESNFLNLMHSIANKETVLENNELKSQENVSTEATAPDVASNSRMADYIQPMYHPEEQMNQINSTEFNTDDFSNETIPNHPLPPQAIPQKQKKRLQRKEPQETQNKLPDPLAHIGDQLDGISDPLTAARIISGGQVKSRDWEDDDDWLTDDVSWRKGHVVEGERDERYGQKRDDSMHVRFAQR